MSMQHATSSQSPDAITCNLPLTTASCPLPRRALLVRYDRCANVDQRGNHRLIGCSPFIGSWPHVATRLLRKPAGPMAKLFKRGLAVRVKYMDINVGFVVGQNPSFKVWPYNA